MSAFSTSETPAQKINIMYYHHVQHLQKQVCTLGGGVGSGKMKRGLLEGVARSGWLRSTIMVVKSAEEGFRDDNFD